MEIIHLGQLQFGSKSKHKAGEGSVLGRYKFFTSSDTQSKFLDSFDLEGPALIFGTGGKASVHYCEEKFATSTDCYSLTTDDKNILLKYIYSYLRGNMYLLEEGFKGAGLEHISKEYLKQIQIPLPPLATQRAIADKLDKLQSLIDLKKQTIAKTDDLAKSIFLEMFGDPMTNEKGWKIMTIKEICEDLFAGGDAPKIYSENRSKEFNIPIYSNGIGIKALYGFTKIPRVLKSSITISARGTIGYCAIINEPFFPIVRLIVMTPKENITNLNYLKYVIDSMNIHGNGGSIPQLTIPMIKDKKISVPPLSLQQKFADIITEIESQKSAHKEALEKLENLYHSEMQRSFSLEL